MYVLSLKGFCDHRHGWVNSGISLSLYFSLASEKEVKALFNSYNLPVKGSGENKFCAFLKKQINTEVLQCM